MIISQLLVISRVSTVQIGHIDGEMIISQLLVISRVSTVQIGVTVISLVSFMSKQMLLISERYARTLYLHFLFLIALQHCELKQAAGAIFHRMISHTTISFSNMIDPVEQVEFCGHPVVFIAPSGFGPPEVST